MEVSEERRSLSRWRCRLLNLDLPFNIANKNLFPLLLRSKRKRNSDQSYLLLQWFPTRCECMRDDLSHVCLHPALRKSLLNPTSKVRIHLPADRLRLRFNFSCGHFNETTVAGWSQISIHSLKNSAEVFAKRHIVSEKDDKLHFRCRDW